MSLSTPMLKFGTFDFIYLNRPIYSSKRLFYIHRPNKKLITKLKNSCDVVKEVDVMIIFSRFDHVWIHKPILHFSLRTTFSHFSTSCKIEVQRLLLALVLKRDPKLNTNHILEYTSYVSTSVTAAFYCLALKIQYPVRRVHLHSHEV